MLPCMIIRIVFSVFVTCNPYTTKWTLKVPLHCVTHLDNQVFLNFGKLEKNTQIQILNFVLHICHRIYQETGFTIHSSSTYTGSLSFSCPFPVQVKIKSDKEGSKDLDKFVPCFGFKQVIFCFVFTDRVHVSSH